MSLILSAQEKYDYIWLLGYHPEPGFPNPIIGGSKLDFHYFPPDTSSFNIPIRFTAIAIMSNFKGYLQFYTNACEIVNKNHEIMTNGSGINPGIYHEVYCSFGYPLSQGVLALPFPKNEGRYVLFHYRNEDTGEKVNLLYSIINMNTPDSLGIVESKNHMLLTDYLGDMLTAVRHGNGRDWWIVAPKTDSGDGYLFLLTPEGIEGPVIRQLGQYWGPNGANGQAVFSPDGTKYARMNRINGLHLADFDRCSGTFSNAIKIDFPNDTITSAGAAFSPNSRFLYVSASSKVYQFDTWAGNIAATKKTVAVYDGFQSPFSTRFFQQMLAPDGKIYITSPSSNNILHVIHNPDMAGLACNLEQHGLTLPTLHAFMTPNFPHFRLYDLAGSPCDTLGIDGPAVATGEPGGGGKANLSVQPNPASETLLIRTDLKETGVWNIVNIAGTILNSGVWTDDNQLLLDVHTLPSGLYYFVLTPDTGRPLATKFSVIH